MTSTTPDLDDGGPAVLGTDEPFTRDDVDRLLKRGLIAPSYPHDPACRDDSYFAISTNP